MQDITKGWLKSARFSGILIFGLIIAGCSSSDDPADTPVNIPPVAINDAFTVDEGMTATPDLAANDTDADDGLDLATITVVASPANGSVSVNTDGTVDYTHDGSETVTDMFTYSIKDNSTAVSNTATVNITVTLVNDQPVAVNDGFEVVKASTKNLDLAANDSDADDGLDPASIEIVAAAANGTVTVKADGTVDYTHDGSNTISDEFTYTIKDNSAALSNTATVTITVTPTAPVNIAPVAVDDGFDVVKGSTKNLDLAANDSDADDGLDPASIEIVAAAANGTVAINTDGSVDYTHDGSNTVSDVFTYTIKDISAAVSNTATVTITVTAAPPPAVHAGIYKSTVVEGADDLEFVISLAAASTGTVSIDYTTADGTAVAGTDYAAANGVVQFAPGELRKFVKVTVLNNPAAPTSTSKNMQLLLSNPQNAVITVDSGTGTIIDKDAMSTDTEYSAGWSPDGPVGAFTNASKCGEACHKAGSTTMTLNGEDISPGTQWKHSVMAQAFNDPYWQAAVEDEVESFPNLAEGFIEDTCTRCHAPMGSTHAHQADTSRLDANGYYRFDTAKLENHAREGVSCTLCHQIGAGNLGTPESFSGGFSILTDSSDPDYKRIYGQYGSPVGNNMNMQTGHRPTEGQYISGSALCATCHTLYTPALDPDTGAPSGIDFLEQGPYLEWQNSVYADGQAQEAQCQDCHMPDAAPNYSTKLSLEGPMGMQARTPYGQHTLVGGNAHLLEILRDYRTALGISSSTFVSGFNDQIALTRSFLGGAASVDISAPSETGGDLNFNIDVINNAGHKLPSAYPSRRTWLHVTVKDNGGRVIFESGKPDARGYISTDDARLKADCMSKDKLDGFDSSVCYEPHRDVITDESQVAIYETVLGDVNGAITHTLLQGAQYLKDNRIPPAGFTNAKAATIELQTVPAGVAGDDDFNCVNTTEGCGKDTVHYQVDITGQAGPYTVDVELLYQATQPGFVDGMHTDGDRVNRFKVMYDAVPPSVEVLASATSP